MAYTPLKLFAVLLLGIVSVFFIAFALKVAWFEHRDGQKRVRGFEVKLNTGEPPVALRKDNDHG